MGPNLTEKLNNMLLKFRTQRYGYTADISRAFLRVGLKKEHRDYTRFLWKSDPSDHNSPFRAYRFKSVLYGATCSPLLHATLAHHFQQTNSIIKQVLAGRFYADGLVDNHCKCGRWNWATDSLLRGRTTAKDPYCERTYRILTLTCCEVGQPLRTPIGRYRKGYSL